jgi:hypothetical protein
LTAFGGIVALVIERDAAPSRVSAIVSAAEIILDLPSGGLPARRSQDRDGASSESLKGSTKPGQLH